MAIGIVWANIWDESIWYTDIWAQTLTITSSRTIVEDKTSDPVDDIVENKT